MKMSLSVHGFVSGANGRNDWIFKAGDGEALSCSVRLSQETGLVIVGGNSFEVINNCV